MPAFSGNNVYYYAKLAISYTAVDIAINIMQTHQRWPWCWWMGTAGWTKTSALSRNQDRTL